MMDGKDVAFVERTILRRCSEPFSDAGDIKDVFTWV